MDGWFCFMVGLNAKRINLPLVRPAVVTSVDLIWRSSAGDVGALTRPQRHSGRHARRVELGKAVRGFCGRLAPLR